MPALTSAKSTATKPQSSINASTPLAWSTGVCTRPTENAALNAYGTDDRANGGYKAQVIDSQCRSITRGVFGIAPAETYSVVQTHCWNEADQRPLNPPAGSDIADLSNGAVFAPAGTARTGASY